tara:strand:- start:50 stop:448 length:399 start_codon:yes stop_codon:yes gene_type:complete
MTVYAIVSITAEGTMFPTYSIEPLGIYSTFEDAQDTVEELEKVTVKTEKKEIAYDIFEFEVDKEPVLLEFLRAQKKIIEESLEETIKELMDTGYVDQLVGEDGHFYYTLTKSGKEKMKSIPEQVRKFFKRKN